MKPKRTFRCGCLLMLIYWLATSMIMLFALPFGFFQLVYRMGDPQEVQKSHCPAWAGKALDVITAPVQVPIYAIVWGVEHIGGARQNYAFQTAIRDADRIVVRDGGYGCCCDIDKAQVYYVVTNRKEIIRFNRMFQFRGKGEGCKCCGDFGVDWWQGTNRIALTAVHHGETLQWEGFDGHYAELTDLSAYAIGMWYMDHCDWKRKPIKQPDANDVKEAQQ